MSCSGSHCNLHKLPDGTASPAPDPSAQHIGCGAGHVATGALSLSSLSFSIAAGDSISASDLTNLKTAITNAKNKFGSFPPYSAGSNPFAVSFDIVDEISNTPRGTIITSKVLNQIAAHYNSMTSGGCVCNSDCGCNQVCGCHNDCGCNYG
ncbi:MAG: hypothetical protein A2504_06985 [Bdellovibrionales bacterium RIFOXYD12_FULL_39_22]|nr:MAG: hypothetical protein A2385_05200 [Bdellovibrionales bacterium RIFOXYB1_FULL_39_21]OFZ44319.1 MAG: hypothetical protein A2485_15980 [Bdellovibrionales bacterium RIFOXYC12_FULL_39_17]OFZ49174.1 MAG: hypothetical protein A2404_15920 [Bdellovibrionales bacterium RIFOXYC1_FULL_39_130]OFZ76982.1 MAG: hypothetical protein A2560_11005 [Bdellovibrionales bacterium RIFOXYD1_FULL_39_84]OFZ95195.1 MAG: hypothetical protein A2504_06985 [Bdellovibrionales bacterium RIFOXYD12_FULL_39_22]HLE09652.1 hy